MKWEERDARDYRIKKYGRWIGIDRIQDVFPDVAGVYVFANRIGQVKYVGKAGPGRLRVESLNAVTQRNKDRGATLARYFVTNSDKQALALERDWIHKYEPINNER